MISNNLRQLYFLIRLNLFHGCNVSNGRNLPYSIVLYILDYVKYDELTDETIGQAVIDYNIDIDTQNLEKRYRVKFLYGPIKYWSTRKITRLDGTFENMRGFNEDISGWDVGNVVSMCKTFKDAISFDGDLSEWNIVNVGCMRKMFENAVRFRCDLSVWNVKRSVHTTGMFECSGLRENVPLWFKPKGEMDCELCCRVHPFFGREFYRPMTLADLQNIMFLFGHNQHTIVPQNIVH